MATQRRPAQNAKTQPKQAAIPKETTSNNSQAPATEVNHAELATKIDELTKALEQAQQNEKHLEQTIEQLQLKEQTTIVQQLQTSVEKTNQMRSELEEAQQTALRLAEQNQSLIQENTEIKTAFEQAQETEKGDEKIIKRLQTKLNEQTEISKRLQSNLEQINDLKAALEQAKQTAKNLTEANEKLTEENKALQEKPTPKPTEPKAQLSLQSNNDMRSHQEILRARQAASLSHPVFPNNPASTSFTDQDIGWVD